MNSLEFQQARLCMHRKSCLLYAWTEASREPLRNRKSLFVINSPGICDFLHFILLLCCRAKQLLKKNKAKSKSSTSVGSSFQWTLVGHQQPRSKAIKTVTVVSRFCSCSPLFIADSLCGGTNRSLQRWPCSSLLLFQGQAGAGCCIWLVLERGYLLHVEQNPLGRPFWAGNCCSWSGNRMGKISLSFF